MRLHIQECGSAFVDADLDLSGCRLHHDRPADDIADPDPAIGRLGDHRGSSLADDDLAVGCLDPQVAADLADPGVAVPALDDCRPVDGADANLARPGLEVGVTGDSIGDDLANPCADGEGTGPIDTDAACASPEAAFLEPALDVVGPHLGFTMNCGAGRELDGDVD